MTAKKGRREQTGLVGLNTRRVLPADIAHANYFGALTVEVAESEGQVIVTLSASPVPTSDFSAVVAVVDNPQISGRAATFGMDYGSGSEGTWRVDFPQGITDASFIVPITTNDAAVETK